MTNTITSYFFVQSLSKTRMIKNIIIFRFKLNESFLSHLLGIIHHNKFGSEI